MRKLLTLCFLLLALSSLSLGQKVAVKANLGAFVLRNFPVSAEYRTGERMSANLQVGYLIPRDITALLEISTDTDLPEIQLRGFSLMPEYRFYLAPFKTSEYLSGFYLAPLIRYQHYQLETGFRIDSLDLGVELAGAWSLIRPGAQIGFQWVLGDHFVIDWFLLGITANFTRLQGQIGTDRPVIDVDQLEQAFEDRLGELPLGLDFASLGLQGQVQSFSASTRNVGVGFRTGISLGVAF